MSPQMHGQTIISPESPGDEINRLFPFVQGELLDDFNKEAIRMEYARGERLYEQGFPCPFVPFLVEGGLRVYKIGESGREITLFRVVPGRVCILSTTCSISDKEYPAIAESEVESVVYVVPGGAFRKMLKKYTDLQDFVFDVMSQRLVEMMGVVEEVAFWRVDLRLANHLLQETSPPRPEEVISTHAQLAIELGTAREVVSRILKEFERKGLVNLIRGKVQVLNRDGLISYRNHLETGSDFQL